MHLLQFLPCDALVHSAVLRLHVFRLSVCLSVTLVDQDHIGWKPWKLIARTISPTPSLFEAQSHPPTLRGTHGNVGDSRAGVGKSGVLEHKSSNISETSKDRGKVPMEGLCEQHAIKILVKRDRGHFQRLTKFFGYPGYSQERVKLQTSNCVRKRSFQRF